MDEKASLPCSATYWFARDATFGSRCFRISDSISVSSNVLFIAERPRVRAGALDVGLATDLVDELRLIGEEAEHRQRGSGSARTRRRDLLRETNLVFSRKRLHEALCDAQALRVG